MQGNDLDTPTIAVVEDKDQPLASKYIEIDENGLIKPFIPLLEIEKHIKHRVVLWAFGGVVEMKDGTGRLWYQKSIDHGGGELDYIGTGVAKVIPSNSCNQQPIAERILTEPHHRYDILFPQGEPRMGTFTAIADGDHFYVFGDRLDGGIILARIYRHYYAEYLVEREGYLFWDGADWVRDWKKAAVVIDGMQQGAIVRSKLFGEDRPFLFVGTSKSADSRVYMGASARLEGPWKIEPVCKADGINEPTTKGKWMYCIYPHLWASDEEKAELMVTWSEQYPGGVIGAKIKLARIKDNGGES